MLIYRLRRRNRHRRPRYPNHLHLGRPASHPAKQRHRSLLKSRSRPINHRSRSRFLRSSSPRPACLLPEIAAAPPSVPVIEPPILAETSQIAELALEAVASAGPVLPLEISEPMPESAGRVAPPPMPTIEPPVFEELPEIIEPPVQPVAPIEGVPPSVSEPTIQPPVFEELADIAGPSVESFSSPEIIEPTAEAVLENIEAVPPVRR